MNKRKLLLLVASNGLLAAAALARAQTRSTTSQRVGVFSPGDRGEDESLLMPFFDEMRLLGWVERQSIAYDSVFASDHLERLPGLAAELVARKPELIVAASPPASNAAKQSTSSIPIVFAVVVDPIAVADVTNPEEFDNSVARLVQQGVEAIIVANGIAATRRARMIEQTARARIPVVGLNQPMAETGALFSFGPSLADQLRRSAHLADRILRGAKPASIPVEAANVLELVINQKSARSLGIDFPSSMLLRADRVIE